MLIEPAWSAPAAIRAAMTTRAGGVSPAPFDGLNLGYATDDARGNVMENEQRVAAALGVMPASIRWVYQVHGTDVRLAEALPLNDPLGATAIQADAIVSRTPGLVCGIKVADCMPVLFAADDGSVVGAAHAGWRGLAGGVVENTLRAMAVPPEQVSVWLGPCIGPQAFEVGEEVREAFLAADSAAGAHFQRRPASTGTAPKFLCDLPGLARQRLAALGVTRVASSNACTYLEPQRFFSHRRDRITGRMAAFVWIADDQRAVTIDAGRPAVDASR